MRTSEWIQTGFAVILAVAAWLPAWFPALSTHAHRLPARRRWTITLLAAVAIAAVALARSTAYFLSPFWVSTIRDWLTAALLLVPYWQTGQFFLEPNVKIQNRLAAWDRRWLPGVAAASGTARTRIGLSMEVAYLFCYPLVPLGLLVLYVAGLHSEVSGFWFVVLMSTYICYAITPFVPALPPRVLTSGQMAGQPQNRGRLLNRWILNHGSIHAISFPSAHVASSLAVSLVLLRDLPLAGVAFLVVTIWIAVGAVLGRYHYALDVLLGAATALAVFLGTVLFR